MPWFPLATAKSKETETMTTIVKNRRIILASRPAGTDYPTAKNLRVDHESTVDTSPSALQEGEILVKTHYISLDPYLLMPMGRAGVHEDIIPDQVDNPYKLKQFKDSSKIFNIGQCFGGRGVGHVVASKHSSVAVGDVVAADWRWQEYAVFNVDQELTFEKLESDIFKGEGAVSLSTALGILSVSGSHALWGYNYCKPEAGKTLVISAAGGSIGTIVGQLAKKDGVRVVGIAGGQDKCEKLKRELGYDAVVDYKQANGDEKELTRLVREACPDGVDAYFDNVAGVVTDAVNNNINHKARVYMCGAVSQYASGGAVTFSQTAEELYKEKEVDAVTCMTADYISKIPEARRELFSYIREGKLKPIEWITEGIENTPAAFEAMFGGKNFGKTIVKVIA